MSADIGKLTRLGFTPGVPLETGLSRYVEWIASQGNVREYFSVVEARLRDARLIRSLAK